MTPAPTLTEAARALARARERVAYLRDCKPDSMERVRTRALLMRLAENVLREAEGTLDAAYRAEEYGEDVE